MDFLSMVIVLALIATAGALFMGLKSMGKGGDYDQEHSEQFMWARVGLQGLAVALLILALLLR